MKQFLSFVQKEFHHIFRDRRTMLILLGMPIVQIILFGFAITTEVKNVKVAVLDYSKIFQPDRLSTNWMPVNTSMFDGYYKTATRPKKHSKEEKPTL